MLKKVLSKITKLYLIFQCRMNQEVKVWILINYLCLFYIGTWVESRFESRTVERSEFFQKWYIIETLFRGRKIKEYDAKPNRYQRI